MPKINVYDLGSVKHSLDEGVVNILKEKYGHTEDHSINNLKLLLGTIACVCAVVAYFRTETILTLLLCLTYVMLSAMLQCFGYFVERDTILITRPKTTGGNGTSSDVDFGAALILRVQADLKDRYSTDYEISFTVLSVSSVGMISKYKTIHPKKPTVKDVWNITELFDEEGTLDETELERRVIGLYKKTIGRSD